MATNRRHHRMDPHLSSLGKVRNTASSHLLRTDNHPPTPTLFLRLGNMAPTSCLLAAHHRGGYPPG